MLKFLTNTYINYTEIIRLYRSGTQLCNMVHRMKNTHNVSGCANLYLY